MFPTHLRGDSSNSPQNFRGSSKKTSSSKNKIDAKQPSNGGIGRVKTHKKGDQASNGSSLLSILLHNIFLSWKRVPKL